MIRAGVGFSDVLNPKTAAAEATAAALQNAGLSRAEGALCFATTAYGAAYTMILRAVATEAKTREVAGCSSLGVIACEQEVETGHALVVIVFGGEGLTARRFFAPTLRGRGAEVAGEIASAVRPALGKTNLLCLFADTYNMDAEALLPALSRELPNTMVTGGGASEDGSVGETFVFCGDVVSNNAASGMLIAGDFDLTVASSLACAPIGPAHRVTSVRDNVILELDGRPAYQVFAEAVGPLAADLRRALAFVFLAVPMDPGADKIERGKFLVRNILGASQEHGALAVSHHPKVGDIVGLVLRDGERARSNLKETLEELREQLKTAPVLGLYFDCVSRGTGLYNIPGHDSAYIRQYLGEIPIGGFFTGFEIGPSGNHAGILQYSGVLALLSERTEKN
ncbi:MAG TPA: FIST N-terminal domain-containing protein [Candidatus Binataceae bacterium]|nr:FIST N-terminal domain-containing protein [Candidatus Binataceae bacterium]